MAEGKQEMPQTPETPKGISRREFLRGTLIGTLGAIATACGVRPTPEEPTPTKAPPIPEKISTPTKDLTPTPTPTETVPTPEVSPTPVKSAQVLEAKVLTIGGEDISPQIFTGESLKLDGEEVPLTVARYVSEKGKFLTDRPLTIPTKIEINGKTIEAEEISEGVFKLAGVAEGGLDAYFVSFILPPYKAEGIPELDFSANPEEFSLGIAMHWRNEAGEITCSTSPLYLPKDEKEAKFGVWVNFNSGMLIRKDYIKQDKEIKQVLNVPEVIVEESIPPELRLDLSKEALAKLSAIYEGIYDTKVLRRLTADQVISAIGLEDPDLKVLYQTYFDGEWHYSMWPTTEYRGLGLYTLTEEGQEPFLHTTVGLLYGFVPIKDIPAKVAKAAEAEKVQPRPMYAVLQIKPGKNLTPEKNPEAFLAVKMGMGIYAGEYNNTGFALKKVEGTELKGFAVARVVDKEANKSYRGTDAWTVKEWAEVFGLKKYSPLFLQGMAATPGEASCSWFSIIVPEFPSQEVQQKNNFSLQ